MALRTNGAAKRFVGVSMAAGASSLAARGRIGAAEPERKPPLRRWRLAVFGPAITAPTENRQPRLSAAAT